MNKKKYHEGDPILRNNRYLNEMVSNYSEVIMYKQEDDIFFLLIDKTSDKGKQLLNEIVTKHKRNIKNLYKYCFNHHSHFFNDLNDDSIKYTLILFTIHLSNIVYMMNTKSFLPNIYILDSVCKKKGYKKGMFQHALHFLFSSKKQLSPSIATYYLSLDIQNPYICSAFCAYLKAGFIPYEIEEINDKDHISMIYNMNSKHIR